VTRERLSRVERSEALVRALGFRVLRVRDLGATARLEVGQDEFARARTLEPELSAALAGADFARLELAVYRAPGH
jgi:PP-loop superfamily ATP-utilizing enzyme